MTVSNFLFHAGIKAGFYAYAGTSYAAGMAIWAYEESTGEDVPFLVEIGITAGTPVALGIMTEAAEVLFKRHAKDMTFHVAKKGFRGARGGSRIMFHGAKKAAGFSARAFARGGAMMMTRVGLRFVPIAGWLIGGYEIVQFLRTDQGKAFAYQLAKEFPDAPIAEPFRIDPNMPNPREVWDFVKPHIM